MNLTIKNWVSNVLNLSDDFSVQNLSLSDYKDIGLKAPEHISSLLLASASTQGLISVRQGLKSFKVHPVIFLANLARTSSDASQAIALSDSCGSAVYDYICNYSLLKIHEQLETADDNAISVINSYFEQPDLSLNPVHTLMQVRSLPSVYPFDKDKESLNQYIDDFFNGKEPFVDAIFDEDLVNRSCGINSYFVSKVFSHQKFDFQRYLQSIQNNDANSPYLYRLDTSDYFGASVCLWRACEHLTYEEKLDKARDYLNLIFGNRDTLLEISHKNVASLLEDAPDEKRRFFANTPRLTLETLDDSLYLSLGHAFAYTTSLGLSPQSGNQFGSDQNTKPFDELVAKLLVNLTHESTIYAGKLLHSDEVLAEASEIVKGFTQEMRI